MKGKEVIAMGAGVGGGCGSSGGFFGNSWAFAVFLILVLLVFSGGWGW